MSRCSRDRRQPAEGRGAGPAAGSAGPGQAPVYVVWEEEQGPDGGGLSGKPWRTGCRRSYATEKAAIAAGCRALSSHRERADIFLELLGDAMLAAIAMSQTSGGGASR